MQRRILSSILLFMFCFTVAAYTPSGASPNSMHVDDMIRRRARKMAHSMDMAMPLFLLTILNPEKAAWRKKYHQQQELKNPVTHKVIINDPQPLDEDTTIKQAAVTMDAVSDQQEMVSLTPIRDVYEERSAKILSFLTENTIFEEELC